MNLSCKMLIDPKPLRVRFDQIDVFEHWLCIKL